jgi:hypothetical protein
MRGVGTVAASGSVHAWSHPLEFRSDKRYSVGRSRVPCESLVSVLEMASEILMQSERSHLMAGDTFFLPQVTAFEDPYYLRGSSVKGAA